MKTLITIFLIFLVSHFDACKESEEQAMRELLKETPHAIISTKNLFSGTSDTVKYFIINTKDKHKVELIEERAIKYSLDSRKPVIRVDSIHKANWYIRL